ncbi:DUF975 family protein [Gorillibacterium massiliense]|uniref:DUF975 family protein n=1 Tax=Gorillibacterium massiliense TaxID=1280390 RepID=UPI0004B03BB8|nr:DUF975 family protein [Gorillibacterium massiliense]
MNTYKTNPEIRAAARSQLTGKWGIGVLAMLINMAISLIIGAFRNDLLSLFLSLLLSGPLTAGLFFVFLKIKRGRETRIPDMFQGFRQFGPTLGLSILQGIFVFLWTLLLIIPGIIAGISYSLAYFILLDQPELNPLEALRQSKQMTKGHKGRLFLLMLSFIGWAILSTLTCGIGYLWLAPYVYTSMANFYDDLKEQTAVQEAPPENSFFIR